MFKFLSAFKPVFALFNSLTKNDELNEMVKESSNSKELLSKALVKAIESQSDTKTK